MNCLTEEEVELAEKLGGNFDYIEKKKDWNDIKEKIFNVIIGNDPDNNDIGGGPIEECIQACEFECGL